MVSNWNENVWTYEKCMDLICAWSTSKMSEIWKCRWSVMECRWSVGGVSVKCWWNAGEVSAYRRPTDGQQSANRVSGVHCGVAFLTFTQSINQLIMAEWQLLLFCHVFTLQKKTFCLLIFSICPFARAMKGQKAGSWLKPCFSWTVSNTV